LFQTAFFSLFQEKQHNFQVSNNSNNKKLKTKKSKLKQCFINISFEQIKNSLSLTHTHILPLFHYALFFF
jgi:hypothetical protein